jgi:hypothetical protein
VRGSGDRGAQDSPDRDQHHIHQDHHQHYARLHSEQAQLVSPHIMRINPTDPTPQFTNCPAVPTIRIDQPASKSWPKIRMNGNALYSPRRRGPDRRPKRIDRVRVTNRHRLRLIFRPDRRKSQDSSSVPPKPIGLLAPACIAARSKVPSHSQCQPVDRPA